MKLKSYTDYALRVLMHLAARPDRLASIGEIARTYRISHNHLMKVVHDLRKEGFLDAVRGRTGGIMLARPASEISVGDVVRCTEGQFDLVDCASCVIAPACALTGVLHEARRAFMAVLDGYSLADLVKDRKDGLRQLLESLATGTAAAAA
ncbi:MAG TPA: Rrf2 family transcriptional regulator [Sphingomicrobium sp.]|nr:Rrf2 family transcriptional regulator [Sphingomicrobium sp.]